MKNVNSMYNLEKFGNDDFYDVFLSGEKPLIIIENDLADTDRELVIFRYSFGSSLSPLLVNSYKKIRYIASPLLKHFIEFKDEQDVLIINTVDVLNNNNTIKVF